MADVSELLLAQEVLQLPKEVADKQRQVRTVRRIIQQLSAQFDKLHLCQFGCMQACAVMKQNEIADVDVTGFDCSNPGAHSSAWR
ncbi:hypothetical protein KIN20_035814 [Parelaphostrongylus tenuis]|uniref:Uncharacterized protein n=1 Tax=Parelaphostrongylus tenuis TaxID=148309 RepID=A0AAD5RC08_PARTN|nr:hypothetical protein KIN20_035814 [Parelaphostrongylus tenuis]